MYTIIVNNSGVTHNGVYYYNSHSSIIGKIGDSDDILKDDRLTSTELFIKITARIQHNSRTQNKTFYQIFLCHRIPWEKTKTLFRYYNLT